MLRETPRPGAPGTAHPSSSRNQDNAEHSHPALAEGILQRKPHTPITKPRTQLSHQPVLAMLHPQKGFWRGGCALSLPVPLPSSDQVLVLSQYILFFTLRKVCSLLCRIPSALQSPDWGTRTAGKQRGAAQRKGQSWMSELGCVYIWGKKALFKVHAFIQRYQERGLPTPAPAGERSSLCHPEPCPSPTTHQVARD